MKTKSKILISSALAIIFCLSLMIGATFALFTSESKVNIAVTSGNVEVVAVASNLTLYSNDEKQSGNTFAVGGTAEMNGNEITIDRMVPMDEVKFDIAIQNYSNVNVKYRVVINQVEDTGLFSALTVTFTEGANSQVFAGGYSYSDWATLIPTDTDAETADLVKTINVSIAFPDGENQNKYQNTACKLTVTVEAVQGNAEVVNPVTKLGDREYEVNSEEGMMLMNGIINSTSHGEGRSLKFYLTDDMDMTGYTWTPISLWWVDVDGQGHTVSNLNCVGDDWGRSGFAGYTGGGSVSNITFENVTSRGTQVGIVSGSCEGFALTNVTIAGTNQVTYDYSINPKETWGGVGAIIGVASYVNDASTVTIAAGAKITVNYNGLMTAAPLQNAYSLSNDISAVVTKNGTVTTVGEPLTFVAEGFGLKTTGEYIITAPVGLANFSQIVKNGETYKGKTVLVGADLDMTDVEFAPIVGFQGTFDGQNKVISNLTISGTENVALFGSAYGTTIKNVTLDNANISGNHFVAGIVSNLTSGTVSGCKVLNSTFTAVPNASGSTYDNGDKVGGIVGLSYTGSDSTVLVSNCSVENLKIKGYRDLGGIAGAADVKDVNGCSAKNVVITADQVTNWYGDKDVNADYIVGRPFHGDVLASNTVSGDNEIITKKEVKSDAALDSAINGALASGEAVDVELTAGTYTLPSNTTNTATIAISGTKDTVIDVTLGAYLEKAELSFEGVTIKGSVGKANGNGSDYAALYSHNVTYTNCYFDGGFRVGRDGAKFIGCTFDLTKTSNTGMEYVWTFGNDVTFEGCTFNTEGKAILVYSDGGSEVSKVEVKNCIFNATKGGAKAGAIKNQNCAAIEIHNYGNGVNLTTSGNTIDSDFSGEWRIKDYVAGRPAIIVNGVTYTTIAIDGKKMTIDANKNVTIVE